MAEIKPIETIYNGYRFRSRLEARWAVFFDVLHVKYEYEPEGFVLSDGSYYLPDFYLPRLKCYFEVKRAGIKYTAEGEEAIRKISDGSRTDSWAGLIAFGDPYEHEMKIFCQECNDGGGGSCQFDVVFGYDTDDKSPMLFTYDNRDRTFFTSFFEAGEIPLYSINAYPEYFLRSIGNQTLKTAKEKARQARFEYSEQRFY